MFPLNLTEILCSVPFKISYGCSLYAFMLHFLYYKLTADSNMHLYNRKHRCFMSPRQLYWNNLYSSMQHKGGFQAVARVEGWPKVAVTVDYALHVVTNVSL